VYFLSLTLENVRCFGPKQTLRLSNEEGVPARWTVILGNNGLGKTTLLQSLTTFEPALLEHGQDSDLERHYLPKGFLHRERLSWSPIRHQAATALLAVELKAGELMSGEGPRRHHQDIQ
jgi:recombinational DNA repair ATPase RecF